MACLSAGDHVLIPDSIYGPSRAFADQVLRRYGVEVEYYPPLEGPGLSKRIRNNTRLVWCESPGSITMEIQDVPAIIAAAHARGVPVALDNTWGAGVLFDGFRHEIDFSAQAITKYIGGHSDLLLGSVTVRDEALYKRIGGAFQQLGMVASPEDCFLALRGLQTLHVRLKAIEESALLVARWLPGRQSSGGAHRQQRNRRRLPTVDLKRLGAVLAVAYQREFHDFASLLLLESLVLELFNRWPWLPR